MEVASRESNGLSLLYYPASRGFDILLLKDIRMGELRVPNTNSVIGGRCHIQLSGKCVIVGSFGCLVAGRRGSVYQL